MEKTLIVNKQECEKILNIKMLVEPMKKVLSDISNKDTVVLQRIMIAHENGNKLANMQASLIDDGVTGSKITIFPGSETAKKGTRQGIIPIFNIDSGALSAIIDAKLITVMRTAATSAAATDILARKDSEVLAVLGSGKQGKAHVKAMIEVRDIKEVYMWSLHFENCKKACAELKTQYKDVNFIACETVKEAVYNADIICTTTPGKSADAILKYEWLKKGVHINAVGACTANGRELDAEIIKNGTIFTDWTEAVLRDAGNIILAKDNDGIDKTMELCEVGEVINNRTTGRKKEDEITIFESVGISAEDISAANIIYKYAKEHNIGTYVEI